MTSRFFLKVVFAKRKFRRSCTCFVANMSLLQIIFGSQSKNNIPVIEEVMQKLKQTEMMLEKKQEYLDLKYDEENATARKHLRTNKRLALQALKRRKRVEEQLRKIDGALTILEFQREALANVQTNMEVFKILNYTALGTLRDARQALDMEDAHDTIDSIHEETEISKEISEAVCGLGSNQDFDDGNEDDDELRAELDAIGQEVPYYTLFGMECLSMGLPDFPSNADRAVTKMKVSGPWSM